MLNKQIVEGRLTAPPELKQTGSGVYVCAFTVASDDDVKKADGSRDTDFVSCVAWREKAEFVSKYLKKGQLVIIEGRPKTRVYEDSNKSKHKVTEIRVDAIYFAESKKDETAPVVSPPISAPAQPRFEEIEGDTDLPF